ncbi:MAG: CapA family protein [Chitinophagales bacterium]|nr:CapA family protein [Chitinophagales bacterium]
MKFKLWLITILIVSCITAKGQLKYVDNDSASFLKLMIVGDVTLTKEILNSSYSEKSKTYDFQHVFHYIRPILNLGDIVIGNAGNSFGIDSNFLDGKTNNAPSEYGIALKYAGFNFLMNANSAAVNQDIEPWLANKKYLDSLHINQIGSFEHDKDRRQRNPTLIKKDDITVAFLNYMDPLPYYTGVSPVVNGVQEDIIKKDILRAINNGAEFIIVYLNWGNEYQSRENVNQKNLADICLNAGADMVVGSGPNTVQNVSVSGEILANRVKKNIVLYSLGDFVSTSTEPLFNSSCIIEIVLKKDKKTNTVEIEDDGFISTYTAMYEDGNKTRYAIMPVSQVEKSNINVPISATEIHWMRSAAEKVRRKFSGAIDEIEYEINDEIIDDVAEVLTVTRRPLNESKNFRLEINNHLLSASNVEDNEEDIASEPIYNEGIIYKVQFLSLRREIPIDTEYYKHLRGYETYKEGDYYHYVIGNFKNLKRANDFCLDVKRNGHKYAYVVAFENGVKVK